MNKKDQSDSMILYNEIMDRVKQKKKRIKTYLLLFIFLSLIIGFARAYLN
jgi:hypothetical protein